MGARAKANRLSDHPLVKSLSVSTDERAAVSAMTLERYNKRLMQVEELSGFSLERALTSPTETYKSISEKYPQSSTTRKSLVTAVLSLFSRNPRFAEKHVASHALWQQVYRLQSKLERSSRDDNVMTAVQREKMFTLSDMRTAASKLRLGLSASESQAHLLLRFMTDMPPKRLDLGSLRVFPRKPAGSVSGNYVVLPASGGATLVLQEYKTAKTYGALEESLPPALASSLRTSLRKYPRGHVFTRKDGCPMSADQYGAYIRLVTSAHTGKSVGINEIRRAYVSEHICPSRVTITEQERIARSMGHSRDMQSRYQLVGYKAGSA